MITISDVMLFPPAETRFQPGGEELLSKVAEMLKQFDYHIQIEGHTDSVPISGKFKSNWELSANRACEVVRILIAEGISPDKLSAEGFAQYRPIGDNDTEEGRARNRRVEFVILEQQKVEMIVDDEGEELGAEEAPEGPGEPTAPTP